MKKEKLHNVGLSSFLRKVFPRRAERPDYCSVSPTGKHKPRLTELGELCAVFECTYCRDTQIAHTEG